MKNLLLADLKLLLPDLLEKRKAALHLSTVGKLYEPMLFEKRKAIDALPPALTGGTPLAAELGDVDKDHDGYGAGVWMMTEAYLRAPGVDAETVAAAQRIRDAFIPAMAELAETYIAEAARAVERQAQLSKAQKEDLKRFPLSGGGTLLDWVVGQLAAGAKLHDLLSLRADLQQGDRGPAGQLRAATIGLLGRLRASIADELAAHPKLPRDLDAKLFGYVDQLAAQRRAAEVSKKPKKGGAATPPAGGSTPNA